MARKLVVCCDGTWNTPRTATNIFRTYEFLRQRLGTPDETTQRGGVRTCSGRAADNTEVVLFYDQGVGTDWFSRLLGGAAGVGLSENVCEAYRFLGQNYAPGSELYIFGFSRGAYTARSLCGFIKAAGLLVAPTMANVWRAYTDLYTTAPRIAAQPRSVDLDSARRRFVELVGNVVGRAGADVSSLPRHSGVKVRFIGVYDTVGALGIPLAGAERLNEPVVGFHDTTLGDTVEHAVQALAVDERRGPYVPSVWTQAADAALLAGQSVLQVWFPGVHSDIGGGYGDRGIGDTTLDFMMRQAAARGLVIDPTERTPPVTLSPLPAQHESFDDTWRKLSSGDVRLMREGVRAIGANVVGPNGEALVAAGEVRLHSSLVSRFGKRCTTILDEEKNERREGDYVPRNVKADTLPVFA